MISLYLQPARGMFNERYIGSKVGRGERRRNAYLIYSIHGDSQELRWFVDGALTK